MPNWKKYKLKITGKTGDGEDLTPLTTPLVRLAEYLADLADVLGYDEHIHLMAVEKSSTAPVLWIDEPVYDRAIQQMRAAERGNGPAPANEAYRRLNNKLREDGRRADFVNAEDETEKVIQFPGKDSERVPVIKPIREQASVTGELRRIGGLDKSIHIGIRRADEEVISVECDELFAKQLEGMLFKYIRINGTATWSRDENGNWKLERFKAQSYDPEPLIDEPFGTTLDKLKSLPGNKWAETDNPFEELRRIRYGDDEKPQ